MLDYLCCQDADLDVGTLGRPAQQIKCLIGSAPVLCHQDSFGLLNHGHAIQPGLEPGKRGIMQYLPLGPVVLRPVNGRLQARFGLLKPPRLGFEFPSRDLQPFGVAYLGLIPGRIHDRDGTSQAWSAAGSMVGAIAP